MPTAGQYFRVLLVVLLPPKGNKKSLLKYQFWFWFFFALVSSTALCTRQGRRGQGQARMCKRPKVLCNSCCIIGTRAEQLIPDERVSASSKGRIRANSCCWRFSFQNGYMRKKRATSDIIAWDYSPEKSLCSLESSSYTPNPKPNLLVPLYQNHSDCSECKLSAMWIKILKSFSFLPFFDGERSYFFTLFSPFWNTISRPDQTWPDLTKPFGIPRTKVKLLVNRGSAGVSSGTPLWFELNNHFFKFFAKSQVSHLVIPVSHYPLGVFVTISMK